MPSFTLKSVLLFAAAVVAVNPPVGTQYNGWETYYNTYDTYGSCGEIGHDTDFVVAVSPDFGHNVECGRKIMIQNPATGASTTAKIIDTCPGCAGHPEHIDLSPAAAKAVNPDYLNSNANIVWKFIS